MVNLDENEKISYRFTIDEAKRRNNRKALRKLQALHPYTGLEIKKLRKEANILRNKENKTADEYKHLVILLEEIIQIFSSKILL